MNKAVLEPLTKPSAAHDEKQSEQEKANHSTSVDSKKAGAKADAGSPDAKKKMGYKDVAQRTIYTILMAYIFLACISVGVRFGIFLTSLICICMFYEVTRINQRVSKERQLPSMKIVKWYFFVASISFVTINATRAPLRNALPALAPLEQILPFIGFSSVMGGLVFFVLSLRKGMYRYQFIQFTWITMTLMVLCAQCSASLHNMMRGMIWFLLPVSCVVNNDIWAYVFGKLFGRTKLLSLSPKKTVEGFLGSFLFTVVWGFWFCGFLSYFPEMYCPAVGFTNEVNTQCVKDPIYIQHEVPLPALLQQLSGGYLTTMLVSRAQQHALVLAVFASLLAPFGGFFASGLKRAFKLKDFGDLIPGHGGMTDRMDCQGIMGIFTYFYLRTYVYDRCPALVDITRCVLALSVTQRRAIMAQIAESLKE